MPIGIKAGENPSADLEAHNTETPVAPADDESSNRLSGTTARESEEAPASEGDMDAAAAAAAATATTTTAGGESGLASRQVGDDE